MKTSPKFYDDQVLH